ncbi:YitT family protein [Bacillus alveayuensis]|uniref:YitT family protein n=1 Tax=Aeribacillus alveayuensis TaxID=279215 RepID=UPI00190FDD83
MHVKKFTIVLIGALLNAIAMNLFLIPANVYTSGFAGVAQLTSKLVGDYTPYEISTGILLFILNIPVAILGWKQVGKLFTFYSFLSVVLMSFFLEIIPVQALSSDILLNAVFGGVIAAVGIGLTLKWGASTGGLDIVALVLSRVKDRPIGIYFFILNAVIILTAGYVYGWEKALYTLVTLYVTTRVIDSIHTRYQKLTAMIITNKGEELKKAIHAKLVRGITTVPAKGAFSNEDKDMLIIVITRYELFDLARIIKEVDPKAFTNIVQTTEVLGLFRKDIG